MIEKNNPHIDVAQLMALVQGEIDRQRGQLSAAGSSTGSGKPVTESNNPYQWSQLQPSLEVAQQNAAAGSQLSSMLHYRKSIRWFFRGIGKIILYIGRVITVPQRNYNNAVLHSLRIILNGIRDINRSNDERFHQVNQRFDDINPRVNELERRDREKEHLIGYLKATLIMQERRVSMFLDEARRCLPETFTQEQLQEIVCEKGHLLDALYVTFEDKFRGTREEIKERLAVYLPLIEQSGGATEQRPLLDIGTGRGEWLELLKDNGFSAHGVDLNDTLVSQCSERGLEVEVHDALQYLRSLPEASLGVITGFHIIEHLPMEMQLDLYSEAVRVLKSGGMAIFETPNPQNLLVGACNFYADPTHKRPLYPETQKFFLEYSGFSKVVLKYLHPHDAGARLPENEAPELAGRLNDLLSCARDYAVIGYKP
jgi:2-polyprenyl-3-methyl-5-hydroxy-6-metoxy-1,4-benzoquinol methylase